jgi:hypothetical protein
MTQAVREREDQALAHVGGDVSGSVMALLPAQGPAFGALPRQRVPPGSDTLLPPAAVIGNDPFVAELFAGLSSSSDIRDVSREALLSGCLATHLVTSLGSGAAVPEATLRWLFAIATSRHCDGEAARSAGAAILTACETAFAARGVTCPPHVEAAITCARLYVTPHRRHGHISPRNGAPVLAWVPSATDFVTALAALGVLGLGASEEAGQQQHGGDVDMADAMEDDDLPPGFTAPSAPATRQQPAGAEVAAPAPMPLNTPLILALLSPCLAIRTASGMPDPDAGTAAQLLLALARLSVDPTACDVAREPIRHAMSAIANALSPNDWATTLHAAAAQLAALPPSAAATAAALHCMPLTSSRCRRLRAFAAQVTLQHMPCCAVKAVANHTGSKAPTTAEAASCCVAVLQNAPLTPGVAMPVLDYAGLCAALRLGNAAMEALLAHGGHAGGAGDSWAEAADADDSPASAAAALPGILDAWRAALQQVAKKVRPSALNLAAVSANGEAARLLARYGKRAGNAQADGEGNGHMSLGVASLGDDDDV